jgi:hypothetical protein
VPRLPWCNRGVRFRAVSGSVAAAVLVGVGVVAAGLTTRSRAAATTLCSRSDVENVVRAFVAAFDAGDQDALASLFAPDPGFNWFSVNDNGERRFFVAYSRPVLRRYFQRRLAKNERLVLRRLEIGTTGGFIYRLTRRADDLPGGRSVTYEGKGQVDCSLEPKAIIVWSMGTGPGPPPVQPGDLHRPLSLYRLDSGSDCPRSYGRPASTLSTSFGSAPALGEGPVYPVVETGPVESTRETASTGVIRYRQGRSEGGWYYVKVLWIESPRYRGPALVRGRQLNGPRSVRFEFGAKPASELELWNGTAGGKGWLGRPAEMRLRGAGCYGLQVDGKNFSRTIVFEAR